MNNDIYAAIDLGTNTSRLLIANVIQNRVDQIQIIRRITRLGGGFASTHGLSEEARKRTLSAVREFASELSKYQITNLKAVGTSAIRDAINGKDYCDQVFKDTGISIEIIDGTTEAVLTLNGVKSGLDADAKQILIFDIGGGSTEYSISSYDKLLFSKSIPLGVVRLTEELESITAMTDKIDRELFLVKKDIESQLGDYSLKESTLIGTAGTATTLAAIALKMSEYDPRKVNNHVLTLNEIRRIYDKIVPLTLVERLQIPGMEKGREDLIIAGILITLKTMEVFNCNKLMVSDNGLLEGILLAAANS